MGQSVVYQEACELFERFMGLSICAPQIQRVCLHYRGMIDSVITTNCESVIPCLDRQDKSDFLYIIVGWMAACFIQDSTSGWNLNWVEYFIKIKWLTSIKGGKKSWIQSM